MRTQEKRERVLTDILNKELEKYNLTIESPEIKDDPEWFKNKTLTDEEYLKWKEYSIALMRRELKMSKIRAEKEFLWLNLMYGLRTENHGKD